MKVLSVIVLLVVIVSCWGYSFLIPPKIGRPGICMYNGLLLKAGDNELPSSCQNMRCNADGSILVQGCGHYDMRDCRIVDPVNLHKPYPECCKMNFLCEMVNGQVVNKEVNPINEGVYA